MGRVDPLFELIKSMTQHEKRYFKLYSSMQYPGKGKNYVKLFEAIDRLKEYDEQRVKRKLSDAAFVKYFAQEKRHLFLNIMKSLRAYHAEISDNAQMSLLIHNLEILLEKGLVRQARKALKKAKTAAADNDLLMELPKIYKLEVRLLEAEGNQKALDEFKAKAEKEVAQILKSIEEKFSL